MTTLTGNDVGEFVRRWSASSSAERANYQLFLSELCDALGVGRPEPTGAEEGRNQYVFEKTVTFRHGDGTTSHGRIDLYKRGCFVLEAKQGADAQAASAIGAGVRRRGTAMRGTAAWDDAMLAARGQADSYVRALPDDNPPFILVMDVGHMIEVYADFSRLGKTYTPFPDARSHRIYLTELADEKVRGQLAAIWTDPLSLDPSRRSARVTRQIAGQLAELAKSLEAAGHPAESVAHFLMRCLFTFFAEDVKLIPDHAFTELLKGLKGRAEQFPHLARTLWKEMDAGGFSVILRHHVLRFNGGLFAESDALPLTERQLELLTGAGDADWQDVEPAIFGTLLERALDPVERHKLGAHYTPRAYVERLVLPTIIEPLREDWQSAQAAAVTLANKGKPDEAVEEMHRFLRKLCATTVLDPACGSGNFLYVTLEHMKRLEGEVRDQLHQFGEMQLPLEYAGLTVHPQQFHGLELNPRAAAIADLVLWIGYLQWHFRTHGNTAPAEPVLRKLNNIECRDAVLAYDRKELVTDEHGKPRSRWDGRTFKKHPVTGEDVPDESARTPIYRYVNPRKATWPKADFVVGNPPFIGNKRMKSILGDEYVIALRNAHNSVPEAADFVMYWWDAAAHLVREGRIRRFGLIPNYSPPPT